MDSSRSLLNTLSQRKAPVAKELQDVMATSEENPSATSITSMMSGVPRKRGKDLRRGKGGVW